MRNIHLIISIFIVIPIAIVYGFFPDSVFEIHPSTIDEHDVFKAIMGLYLAFSLLWILGLLEPKYWKSATTSNMLFMFGLAFGRVLSLFFDGIPSALFCFGIVGEIVLGAFALYQLQNHSEL